MKRVCFLLFLLSFCMASCSPVNQSIESSQSEDSVSTNAVQSETKQIEGLKLEGRGRSDQGRSEPQYEGIIGYVAASKSGVDTSGSKKFPNPPWYVYQLKQIGDDLYKPTTTKVKHKTKVKVIKQYLQDQRFGFYEGALLVQTMEGPKKEFLIDVNNFVSYDYWNDSLMEAVSQGPLIVSYNGNGRKPTDGSKEWVEVGKGSKVYVTGRAGIGSDRDIEGEVFKRWKYGFGGVIVHFDKESLEIVY